MKKSDRYAQHRAGGLYKSQTSDDSILDYTILEVFPQDGSTFCRVQAYLARRSLVESVAEILSLAGKKPYCYTVAQHCLYQLQHLGKRFSSGDIIAANVGSSRIHVTLLAQPNISLTRSDVVMPGKQAFSDSAGHRYDVSAAMEAATQNISKMMQYQSIKYPGRACDSIFIFGDTASEEMAGGISAALGLPVSLLPARPRYPRPADFYSIITHMQRGRCWKNEQEFENDRKYVSKQKSRADERKIRKLRLYTRTCVHRPRGVRGRRIFPGDGARKHARYADRNRRPVYRGPCP